VSNITEVKIEDIIRVESPLFKNPPQSVNIDAKNPYDVEGIFKVTLREEVVNRYY